MRLALLCLGIATALASPALAEDPSPDATLTDRIWVRSDIEDRPGAMQLFMSDGTLLSTSCWEGYRLSQWRWEDEGRVAWEEDGMTIPAQIVSLGDDELVLELSLVSEVVTQSFVPAEAPYVCPDMVR